LSYFSLASAKVLLFFELTKHFIVLFHFLPSQALYFVFSVCKNRLAFVTKYAFRVYSFRQFID